MRRNVKDKKRLLWASCASCELLRGRRSCMMENGKGEQRGIRRLMTTGI
jgi:hypothetical protein